MVGLQRSPQPEVRVSEQDEIELSELASDAGEDGDDDIFFDAEMDLDGCNIASETSAIVQEQKACRPRIYLAWLRSRLTMKTLCAFLTFIVFVLTAVSVAVSWQSADTGNRYALQSLLWTELGTCQANQDLLNSSLCDHITLPTPEQRSDQFLNREGLQDHLDETLDGVQTHTYGHYQEPSAGYICFLYLGTVKLSILVRSFVYSSASCVVVKSTWDSTNVSMAESLFLRLEGLYWGDWHSRKPKLCTHILQEPGTPCLFYYYTYRGRIIPLRSIAIFCAVTITIAVVIGNSMYKYGFPHVELWVTLVTFTVFQPPIPTYETFHPLIYLLINKTPMPLLDQTPLSDAESLQWPSPSKGPGRSWDTSTPLDQPLVRQDQEGR